LGSKKRMMVAERTLFHGSSIDERESPSFDPFNLLSEDRLDSAVSTKRVALSVTSTVVPLTTLASSAVAASNSAISTGNLDPANFKPVREERRV